MSRDNQRHAASKDTSVSAKIDDTFSFIEDVIADPSVLDRIPNGASIQLTRRPAGEEHASVVTHTKRFAVTLEERPDRS